MKKVHLTLALSLSIVFTGLVWAANQEDDVKELVNGAVTFINDKGSDYSMKVFSAINGPFFKGSMYVMAGDFSGQILAHPDKKLRDSSLWDTKDIKGKLFIQEMVDVAKSGDAGWVEYWWPHPVTKEITMKRSYVKRVPGADVWVAVGYYANCPLPIHMIDPAEIG
jgi:cytochrome c